MDSDLERAAAQWLSFDKNPLTAALVRSMLQDKNVSELQRCFGSRMEFGTAGLRAAMGPGVSCMNQLTIVQTTQCFSDLRQRGVVIGFDARSHPPSGGSSKGFAGLAAAVFISRGVPVFLFSDITPTPYVPFTVSRLGVCAGIMVTASHNPKQDNGYKVYWDNGAQIVSPHDKRISAAIEENLEPWPDSWNTHTLSESHLITDPLHETHTHYCASIQRHCCHRDLNRSSGRRAVHTSLHGVAHAFVQAAFQAFDLPPPLPVPEQKDPDPEFPTVKFPNPEEGEGVLALSFALADKEGVTLVLANDPDADRLAVAEKQESGQWRVFSGNELGSLLGWWMFQCWKQQNKVPNSSVSDCVMFSSTVSSKILRAIAQKEGFHFQETLTGFKWMGNRAKEMMDQGKTVLFAFEEAIGYMCSPLVLDKDGVSAAVIVGEMSTFLSSRHLTLSQQLLAIYQEYGFHISRNSYFICHDRAVIKRMFERLRNYGGANRYPADCGGITVTTVRDLTTGFDSSQPDNKAVLPTSSSSQMITFTFANGCVATMRTSGTEPKIKYYTELCAEPGDSNQQRLQMELEKLVSALVENFFQPEKNGLIPPSK